MDKSLSETNLLTKCNTTPPNFFGPFKRKRDDDFTLEFNKFKEEMRNMISSIVTSQGKEFGKNTSILKEIQQTNHNIENSIAFLSAQNEEFKKKIENLESQTKEDRKYITLLEDKIEDMLRDSRKGNFVIKNVPKHKDETKEDLIEMVTNLTKNIGCESISKDIKDIYRVRVKDKKDKNTPIIVETSSTLLKNNFLKLSRAYNIKHSTKLCAKQLGIKSPEASRHPIFISEQLTAKASRLYFLARDLAKSKSFKYCWTSYGKVYLKKDDDANVLLIRSELQVQKLMSTA